MSYARPQQPHNHIHAIHAAISFIISIVGMAELYFLDLRGYDVAANPPVFAVSITLIIVVLVVLFAVHERLGLRA